MWVEFRVVEFGGDIKKKDMNSCIYYALVISFYIIECYFLTYTLECGVYQRVELEPHKNKKS